MTFKPQIRYVESQGKFLGCCDMLKISFEAVIGSNEVVVFNKGELFKEMILSFVINETMFREITNIIAVETYERTAMKLN